MKYSFIPPAYVGGPSAIVEKCKDGSMADIVKVVQGDKILTLRLTSFLDLADSVSQLNHTESL